MVLTPIKADILAIKMIPNVSPDLANSLQLTSEQRSIGMITCTIDDAGYAALDEATKMATVDVVYAESFYCGAAHASGPLSGEFIGILAGPNPAEVKSGIDATIQYLEHEAFFYTADEAGKIVFYPHVISRTGTYLSKITGIPEGQPLAYLIAPPIESVYGVDAALKAAEVELKAWFGPPTRTNFGGALLTGSQSACRAAADAFQSAILSVAKAPRDF